MVTVKETLAKLLDKGRNVVGRKAPVSGPRYPDCPTLNSEAKERLAEGNETERASPAEQPVENPMRFFGKENGGVRTNLRNPTLASKNESQPKNIVWFGEWHSDGVGLEETRSSVAILDGRYLPGFEVSYQGGDCEPSYGDGFLTLEEAKTSAQAREASWHLGLDIQETRIDETADKTELHKAKADYDRALRERAESIDPRHDRRSLPERDQNTLEMDLRDDAQHILALKFASREPAMGRSSRNDWADECFGTVCYNDRPESISPDSDIAELARNFFDGPDAALSASQKRLNAFEALCHEQTNSLNSDYQLYFDEEMARIHSDFEHSKGLLREISASERQGGTTDGPEIG